MIMLCCDCFLLSCLQFYITIFIAFQQEICIRIPEYVMEDDLVKLKFSIAPRWDIAPHQH